MNDETRWLAEGGTSSTPTFRLGIRGARLVAEWPKTCVLSANRDGSSPEVTWTPDTQPAHAAKLASGAVAGLLWHAGGKLALHGAAVAWQGRAVVLLGRSGAGKSTFAAAACRDWGASLISDDVVRVDLTGPSVRIHPTDTVCWIREGDGPDKVPVTCTAASGPVTLAALAALHFDDTHGIRITATHGLEALAVLIPQVVRFIMDDPEVHLRDLHHLETLLARVPLHTLSRPRSLGRIPDSVNAMVELLSGGAERLT